MDEKELAKELKAWANRPENQGVMVQNGVLWVLKHIGRPRVDQETCES